MRTIGGMVFFRDDYVPEEVLEALHRAGFTAVWMVPRGYPEDGYLEVTIQSESGDGDVHDQIRAIVAPYEGDLSECGPEEPARSRAQAAVLQ
jgi:hypothetical protein